MKERLMGLWRHVVLASALGLFAFASTTAVAQQKRNVNMQQCYACHQPIQELQAASKHKGVNCVACHDKLAEHMTTPTVRPGTDVNPAACGTCHKDQFDSQYQMNWKKKARHDKTLGAGPTPNPAFNKLMSPHPFTREHAEPRSHAFMVIGQFSADRAFGGRFVAKDGWKFYATAGGNVAAWDVLMDKYPGEPHKIFETGYGAAANPVCMSCKSQDHILDWAYMGDPHPNARLSRLSNVLDVAKSVNYAVNCFMCHDPHSGGPRVVRDALIDAITRPSGTLFHTDPHAAKIDVREVGLRGYTRKVAHMDRYDTNLMCGQCHVEYVCNPGFDNTTGEPVGMADRRTNLFQYVDIWNIHRVMNEYNFRDFRHEITGTLLMKVQHPDVEIYYNSTHQLAGVGCQDCHMPKLKNRAGKTYTSHWVTSPKNYIKETCLTCHKDWNETQASYVIDSMKYRYFSKMRHAEFWLTRLIDKFEEARNMGIDAAVIEEARKVHDEAHMHWEWWGAANGAYFHNQEQAVKSLNYGQNLSRQMITKLDAEMAKVRAARK